MPAEAEVSPKHAFSAIRDDGAVLIDVREPWESDEMRIPGAMMMPLSEIPGRLSEIPEGRDIFMYCRAGGRSARAAQFLREHGRPRAYNVSGGIDAWKEAGLPIEE